MRRYLTDRSENLLLDKHYGETDHTDWNMHQPLQRRHTHTWHGDSFLDGDDPANVQR